VEARLSDVATGKAEAWSALGTVQADFTYEGKLIAPSGWYTLDVRARSEGIEATTSVERVGVGEVCDSNTP
jgi:hypothetical protein